MQTQVHADTNNVLSCERNSAVLNAEPGDAAVTSANFSAADADMDASYPRHPQHLAMAPYLVPIEVAGGVRFVSGGHAV